jgi:hypothetical protein
MATGLVGSAVDGSTGKAYYLQAMKLFISRYLALAAVLSGTGFPVAAEDLDAALAAQKKKAQRQIYSESALLEDRNLTVPKTRSEEERLLDKKLQEMDARAAADASDQNLTGRSSPAQLPSLPVENKNWLTPAMLDEAAAMSTPDSKEDDWLAKEKERQKSLKDQESVRKENELVDKLLREQTQPTAHVTSEMERLKKYQIGPQNFNAAKDPVSASPGYKIPQSQRADPLAAVRLTPKKQAPVAPAIFSPEAARLSSALDKDPLAATRSPLLNSSIGAPSRKGPSIFSSGLSEPETAPLTPLQMLRKSSPINRQNPFEDDHMPQIKRSIWE